MATKSGLERRGAVYYWRVRIPRHLVKIIGRTHMRVCLGTKEPGAARSLALRLNATADEAFLTMPDEISEAQLKALFQSAFEQHRNKLRLLADDQRNSGSFDAAAETKLNRTIGLAYRHMSRFGPEAPLDAPARESLVADGATEAELDAIAREIARLRMDGLEKGSLTHLRRLLVELDIEQTAANITAARPVYLRALGEALLDAAAAPSADRLPYAAILEEMKTPSSLPPASAVPPPAVAKTKRVPVQDATPVAPVEEVGERLIKRKTMDKEWSAKTARQARSIYDLFSRFLIETVGTDDLTRIGKKDLDAFNQFLLELKKRYGRGKGDKVKSIKKLRAESARLPAEEQGLAIPTRNRHLTNLGVLFQEARKFSTIDPELKVSDFRGRDKRSKRQVVAKPDIGQVGQVFHSPVFIGCADWEHPKVPGDQIFHRAIYYGTLIGVYSGARREEYCGLTTSDVIRDNGPHPYLHIAFTEQRRIKNVQSVRNLVLHPEVLRLGFLDYVAAIESLGYTLLFPDLYSPSTTTPLGDRFYAELSPILKTSGITPHQWRHYFDNTLKKLRISTEERGDLMGHLHGTETADRYCDPTEIEVQLEILSHLPILTAHLEPVPIRLVPWVEHKLIAPWSRAAREARRKPAPATRQRPRLRRRRVKLVRRDGEGA